MVDGRNERRGREKKQCSELQNTTGRIVQERARGGEGTGWMGGTGIWSEELSVMSRGGRRLGVGFGTAKYEE